MIVTYVTYVRTLDWIRQMPELTSFADRDHEASTYTLVSCSLLEQAY